jgi:hypothetical protein
MSPERSVSNQARGEFPKKDRVAAPFRISTRPARKIDVSR